MPTYLVGPTRTYTTIQAAVAARSGSGIHNIIVDAGTYTLTADISIGLLDDTASNCMTLVAASGSEWAGDFYAGVRINAVNLYSISCRPYSVFRNIVVYNGGAITCDDHSLLENVIHQGDKNAFVNTSLGTATLYKCIAVCTGGGFRTGFLFNTSNGNSKLYNCAAYNYYTCFAGDGSTTVAKNCWAIKTSGGQSDFSGCPSALCSNNASSDTTAPGANSLINQTETNFNLRSPIGFNYHMGSLSTLRGAGLDLSSLFTTDIDLETITTWSIGPDSQYSAGTTTYRVGPTRQFLTFNSAFAAIPSVITGTGIHNVIVDAGLYQQQVLLSKTGTSATEYVNIYADVGSEHRGIYTAGVRVINGQFNTSTFSIFTNFTRVQDIVCIFDIANNQGNSALINANDCTIRNCLALCSMAGSFSVGFRNVGSRNNYICCLAFPVGANPTRNVIGFFNQGGVGGVGNNAWNCGAFGLSNGFSWSGSNCINCWAIDMTGFCYTGSGFSILFSYSSDSTASVIPSRINITTAQAAFVSASTYNFHILPTSVFSIAGTNLSALFTTDIDGETIVNWPVGPDFYLVPVIQYTSSSPATNDQEPHETVEDAKSPGIIVLKPGASPDFNSNTKQNKVGRLNNIKTVAPQASPSRNNKGGSPRDAKNTSFKTDQSVSSSPGINKGNGYKDGFLSVIPERGGVNSGTLGTGQKLAFYNDTLEIRKRFAEYEGVTDSRQFKGRHDLGERPQGGFSYTLKTNDSIPLFMSHFQNRHGSNLNGGTTYYEFAPAFPSPTIKGSSFGTGTYGYATFNAYTVSVYKAIHGTGYHFKSGICDSLNFFFLPIGVAEVNADFRFGTASLVGTSQMGSVGTYSRLPALPLSTATIYFAGLPITSMQINSKNNLKESNVVGTEANLYRFGNYEVTGRVTVDMPKDSLAYIGSMLSNQSFSVYGTLSNSAKDKFVFQMPTCKLDYFDTTINNDIMEIPFRAYASEDGSTPPLKLMLWTQNYSATSFEPN